MRVAASKDKINYVINGKLFSFLQVSWSGSHEGHGKQYYEFNHVDHSSHHHPHHHHK